MTADIDPIQRADGVLKGSRTAIGQAITLAESTRPNHRKQADEMLARLLPHSHDARRIGITGIPGVGKSTFIDALGSFLTQRGYRVAVLAVDPSSPRSGGSLLGDKTRMARLAADPQAFVRPAATSGTLGGVTRATRDCLIILAAAGYDVLLVETVGVGQSETLVSRITDSFLLLALARTGDQLQGIKKGVLELADIIAVNKADAPYEREAKRASRELAGALRLISQPDDGWITPVVTCSALTGAGIPEIWTLLQNHEASLRASGELESNRESQRVDWMWSLVRERVLDRLRDDTELRALAPSLESAVRSGQLAPAAAAAQLIDAFLGGRI